MIHSKQYTVITNKMLFNLLINDWGRGTKVVASLVLTM